MKFEYPSLTIDGTALTVRPSPRGGEPRARHCAGDGRRGPKVGQTYRCSSRHLVAPVRGPRERGRMAGMKKGEWWGGFANTLTEWDHPLSVA